MQRNRQASRIKELRDQKKISQRQLAKQLPLSYSTLSRYERGVTRPDGSTIVQIATALGVAPQDIDPDFNSSVANELKRIDSDLRRIEELQEAIEEMQQRINDIQRSVAARQRALLICVS